MDRKIEVAAKYKIDPEPYMRVEYFIPKTGQHEVVEFGSDLISGVSWYESDKTYKLRYFLAGMLWGYACAWLVMVVRWL